MIKCSIHVFFVRLVINNAMLNLRIEIIRHQKNFHFRFSVAQAANERSPDSSQERIIHLGSCQVVDEEPRLGGLDRRRQSEKLDRHDSSQRRHRNRRPVDQQGSDIAQLSFGRKPKSTRNSADGASAVQLPSSTSKRQTRA